MGKSHQFMACCLLVVMVKIKEIKMETTMNPANTDTGGGK